MKITDVTLTLNVNPNRGLLAYATVVLDDCLKITDIKILYGPRLALPSRLERVKCLDCNRNVNCTAKYCEHCGLQLTPQRRKFFNTTYPINSDFRKYLEYVLFEKLKNSMASAADLETRQSSEAFDSTPNQTSETVLP